MKPPLADLVDELLQRVRALVRDDPAWRDLLGRLAEETLAIVAESSAAEAETDAPEPAEAPSNAQASKTPPRDPAEPPFEELVRRLTLGRSAPPAKDAELAPQVPAEAALPPDLALLERRCRLKAEACDWAEQRQHLLDTGADFRTEIEPRDSQLIDRARQLPDCYLWMSTPDAPAAASPHDYVVLGRSFDALADALAHIRVVQDESDSASDALHNALRLLAEAQSAVLTATTRLGLARHDNDQKQAYLCLRDAANGAQVRLTRHMAAEDPASPEGWADLAARIAEASAAFEQQRKAAARRRKLLGKVVHKASMIEAGDEPDASWRVLIETVETLVAEGLSPSDRQLREALLPIIDDAPDAAAEAPNFQRVLREVDRYLASRPAPRSTAGAAYNPEVAELRRLLAGRSIVLIGGERRVEAHEKLRAALEVAELHWLTTQPHESIDRFERYVARADVAVVIQLIRFSSHCFGDVDAFCRRHGKPFVRLTGGYNPNQVAAQVLQQCSERL